MWNLLPWDIPVLNRLVPVPSGYSLLPELAGAGWAPIKQQLLLCYADGAATPGLGPVASATSAGCEAAVSNTIAFGPITAAGPHCARDHSSDRKDSWLHKEAQN